MDIRLKHKTPVLLIAPETGRLPEKMGLLAKYIYGKSGGMGDVVAYLCEGLTQRGIDCHIATLNLRGRFKAENNLAENEWQKIRHTIDPECIHLVSSSVFADLPSAYAGDPLRNAAEFQKTLVNQIIIAIRAKNGGSIIIHSHDWMAGGAVTAYAKLRGCPVLHTIHNVHTGHIPLEMLSGMAMDPLSEYLYYSNDQGKRCIDSQATAIKSATLVSFVGKQFLKEIIEDHFPDHRIIPESVRSEVKAKYYNGSALAIQNAPSPLIHPERCAGLVRNFGAEDDVIRAKKDNLVEFQKRTGLNVDPGAILLYWPSRLDPVQKGVHLLEDIAQRFVNAHGDTQIAIVGNGVDGDATHEKICGQIAWASGGKITYQRFDESLSRLGFAAAGDTFGASLYEPCGQIDQIGNLYGTTSTNRDTGGYHDKIREISMNGNGYYQDSGNGFLFRDYDAGGLWYGLERSVQFHRQPPGRKEKHIKRIMREARQRHNLDGMIDGYVEVYERLNGGRPLI